MNNINFEKLHKKRKRFLDENKNMDHVLKKGQKSVLISAPHGVMQYRLGKRKFKEIGSLSTALYLQERTNSFLIAKTKCNFDDANYDENCAYRKTMQKIIAQNNIKYLIDIHGLAEKRKCDVNLGIHLGENIQSNPKAFDLLNSELVKNGFVVLIDQPFMAGSRTISGSMKDKYPRLWTIQIEINCGITNKPENFEKYKRLLTILENWVNKLD